MRGPWAADFVVMNHDHFHDHFAVTGRQMKRWELLENVKDGKLTLTTVAPALRVSYRQAQRLKEKVSAEGLRGLGHGNRGRAPADAHPSALRAQVLALSQSSYANFNDTHFCQELAHREGMVVGRETVRRWRRDAGIAPKRKRRPRSIADAGPESWRKA